MCRADLDKSNSSGRTPLHVAAAYGHVAAMEVMISHGANLWALDMNGRTAAKLAAFHQKIEACRFLDMLALRWETENKDYVEKMQVKAMKDLKRRVKKASEESSKEGKVGSGKVAKRLLYEHATAPPGTASPVTGTKTPANGGTTSAEPVGRRKKLSTHDALRVNFELRPSNSTGNVRDDEEDSVSRDEEDTPFKTHSAGNTFSPIPRTTAGPLLNTLQSLTPKLKPLHRSPLESGLGRPVSAASSGGSSTAPSRSPQSVGALAELTVVNPSSSSGSVIVENDSPLAAFLQSLDLADCAQLLNKEKLDLSALALCSEKDLIAIGLPLGPRKKILHAIDRRRQLAISPGQLSDTDL